MPDMKIDRLPVYTKYFTGSILVIPVWPAVAKELHIFV
jgi:hypothetical protein